jgi:hypothetical protein
LPPLSFDDVSLLLAVTAIVLLITYELSSSYYGKATISINKRKLRNVTLSASTLFLIAVTVRIVGIITGI